MHIGFVTLAWPPEAVANGAVTYVRIVREELMRQGHRVSLFCGFGETDLAQGVHVVRVDRAARVLASVRRGLGLQKKGDEAFADNLAQTVRKVHATQPLDVLEMEEAFGTCGVVAPRLPVPLVVKLHGPAFLSVMASAAGLAQREQRIRDEGDALRKSRAIVAPSRATLDDTALHYGLDRQCLTCIPNPVEPVPPSLLWRTDRRRADEILFVGRFDRRKGGDAVLQVFARLAALRPTLRLTFVGPDEGIADERGNIVKFADHLATHVPQELAARVHYVGSRPLADIQAMRAQCAVAVIATRWESFGYVVAESMMQGCPVVAFDVPGVNELIAHGRSGLLAPLDDIDALAALVGDLLDHPDKAAALGVQARASVIGQCGADAVVRQMVDLYQSLARPRAELSLASR